MCERTEIAARTDAPALGHDGMDAGVEQVDEALQGDASDAAEAARECLDAQEHHASDDDLRERVTDAAGMGDHEPVLELLCVVRRDAGIAVGAEACGDAVDALGGSGGAGDDVGGAVDEAGSV